MIDLATIKAKREEAGFTKTYMAAVLCIDRHSYARKESNGKWKLKEWRRLDLFYRILHSVPDIAKGDLIVAVKVNNFLEQAPIEKTEEFARKIGKHEDLADFHITVLQKIDERKRQAE